jgi:DNA-binding transcriptional LysR family regulator
MQVRSFDAVCHLVAAGLGVALLPKAAALPMATSMKLHWRALSNTWAQRRLLMATRAGLQEPAVVELLEFLEPVSQKAKARTSKQQ